MTATAAAQPRDDDGDFVSSLLEHDRSGSSAGVHSARTNRLGCEPHWSSGGQDQSGHRESDCAVGPDEWLERLFRLLQERGELRLVEHAAERPHARPLGGDQRPDRGESDAALVPRHLRIRDPGRGGDRAQAFRVPEHEGGSKGIRDAIALYYLRSPGAARRYPRRLEDLLQDDRYPVVVRYLRRIYADPMTGSTRWGLIEAPGGGIMGVYSLSGAAPLKRAGFSHENKGFESARRYAEWRFLFNPEAARAAWAERTTPRR